MCISYKQNPKILLLNIELELKSEKENAEVRLQDPAQYQSIVDAGGCWVGTGLGGVGWLLCNGTAMLEGPFQSSVAVDAVACSCWVLCCVLCVLRMLRVCLPLQLLPPSSRPTTHI